jgi:hypothetical protein
MFSELVDAAANHPFAKPSRASHRGLFGGRDLDAAYGLLTSNFEVPTRYFVGTFSCAS